MSPEKKHKEPSEGAKISSRVIGAGILITALFVLSTLLWVLPTAEHALLTRKKEKIREQTEAAWSILSHCQALEKAGTLTKEQAQQRAVAIIRNMRYGPEMKDYFWINDMHPRMVMHPYRADLNGQDLSTYEDPDGTLLFVEMVRVCRDNGEGFVEYAWQWKDDAEKVVPKISYVRRFRPWQWIIGTGMYIEDVREEIAVWKTRIITVYALFAVIGVILSWLVGRMVAHRFTRLRRAGEEGFGADESAGGGALTWSLQNFILLVTIPCLVLIVAVWCVFFYRDLYGLIIDGFDKKLLAISSSTACFIDGGDHAELATGKYSEDSDLYTKYIDPMKLIAKGAGLTYLYSQVMNEEEERGIKYILDATEGEDHTEIGYPDKLPEYGYKGALKVMLYEVVHVGDVEETDEWGLIKVSYAPIYTRAGIVNGMAGADVNVSIINRKTEQATFQISMVGVIALLVALYLSLLTSRRLTRPLSMLRAGALKLAGGAYDQKVQVRAVSELERLGLSFGRIGIRLGETLKETEAFQQQLAVRNKRRDLITALDGSEKGVFSSVRAGCAFAWLDNRADARTASGWVAEGRNVLAWLAAPVSDPLDAVKLRNDIRLMGKGLLARFAEQPDRLAEELRTVFGAEVRAFFLRRHGAAELLCVPHTGVDVLAVDPHLNVEPLSLAEERTIEVRDGLRILVADTVERMRELLEGMPDGAGGSPADLVAVLQLQTRGDAGERQIMAGVFF